MTYYLLIFLAGLAGSFHCVGMCGGFACALGRDPAGRVTLLERHLLYNTGRLATYVFLGLLAGLLGATFVGTGTFENLTLAPRVLAIVAGLLMIVMALSFFGRFAGLHRTITGFAERTRAGAARQGWRTSGPGGTVLAAALRQTFGASGRSAPLALGVFNGFLPCPLVYAFAALAATGANVTGGVLTMLAFGLGTYPAMLMMGGLGQWLRPAWRQRGVWAAGIFILALGLVTMARGILPPGGHLHFFP